MKLFAMVPLALAAFLSSSVLATPTEADASLAVRHGQGQVGARGTASECDCLYVSDPVRLQSRRRRLFHPTALFPSLENELLIVYSALPTCCVPTVCMCFDGRIYEINRDNQARDIHGCVGEPAVLCYPIGHGFLFSSSANYY